MTVFNEERLEGIHRWHEWFRRCLSPDPNVKDCSWEIEGGTVSWCIEFQDGAQACVQVTDETLRLSEDDFAGLADRIDNEAWFEVLLGLRIHSEGRLELFDSEEVWGSRSSA